MPLRYKGELRLAPRFLTSEPDGGEWSPSRPHRFTPGREPPGAQWIGGFFGPNGMVKRKLKSLTCKKLLFVHWHKFSEHSVFHFTPLSFCGCSTESALLTVMNPPLQNRFSLVRITDNYFKIFQLQNSSHDALRLAVTS
jgi:hypothetical protein